jgi:hypothetical protein
MAGYVLAWRRAGGLEVQFEDGYPALPSRPLSRGGSQSVSTTATGSVRICAGDARSGSVR